MVLQRVQLKANSWVESGKNRDDLERNECRYNSWSLLGFAGRALYAAGFLIFVV